MNTALQIAFAGGYGKLGADDNVVGKGLLSFLFPFSLHAVVSILKFEIEFLLKKGLFEKVYTANIYSPITDKLRHLFVAQYLK